MEAIRDYVLSFLTKEEREKRRMLADTLTPAPLFLPHADTGKITHTENGFLEAVRDYVWSFLMKEDGPLLQHMIKEIETGSPISPAEAKRYC